MAKDPVCGKQVDEQTAEFTSEHLGYSYYFCREECKDKFDSSPFTYATRRITPVRRGGCCG